MVLKIASLAAKAKGDVAKLLAMTYPGTKATVEDHVKEMVATIGENMTVRRTATLEVPKGVVGSYMHNQVGAGSRQDRRPGRARVRRQEADELARSCPHDRHARGRDQSGGARSRGRAGRDARAREGDPRRQEQGQARRRCSRRSWRAASRAMPRRTACSIRPTSTILQRASTQALKEAEGKVGGPVKITGFVRYALGEGIEKKDDDFAAEVAAAAGGLDADSVRSCGRSLLSDGTGESGLHALGRTAGRPPVARRCAWGKRGGGGHGGRRGRPRLRSTSGCS